MTAQTAQNESQRKREDHAPAYWNQAGLPYLPPWLGWVTQFDARLWWKAELEEEKSLRKVKPRHICRAGPDR